MLSPKEMFPRSLSVNSLLYQSIWATVLWNTSLTHHVIIILSRRSVSTGLIYNEHFEGFSLSLCTTRRNVAVWKNTQMVQSADTTDVLTVYSANSLPRSMLSHVSARKVNGKYTCVPNCSLHNNVSTPFPLVKIYAFVQASLNIDGNGWLQNVTEISSTQVSDSHLSPPGALQSRRASLQWT